MTTKFVGISVFLFSMFAFANDQSCPDAVERKGNLIVQQSSFGGGAICYLSIHPTNVQNLVYRDYLLSSDGNFMVFNSYGEGPDTSTTGAREFYFFPRVLPKNSFEWSEKTNELIVTLVTGDKVTFDLEKAELKSHSGASVVVRPEIATNNGGGVEFKVTHGVVLDGGFQMGAAPTANSSRISKFVDKHGVVCKMANSKLFRYYSNGDVKYGLTDEQTKSLLKSSCTNLNTDF